MRSAPTSSGRRRRALRALTPFHDRLIGYVVAAAAAGVLLPEVARACDGAVPYLLAGQVAGVALTLEARRLVAVLRRWHVLIAALTLQWTVLPLLGIAFAHLPGSTTVTGGAAICAAVPAEVTSSLVAVLAAGSGEMAITLVAGSLALGTLLTPLWVGVALGAGAQVDRGGLVLELAVCVAVPLVVCVAVRSAVPALARQGARCLDLSAFSVVAVVFVAAGSVRRLDGAGVLGATALCVALQVAGFALGRLLGVVLRLDRAASRAVLFPLGMREFGVAAAVALAVLPSGAGVAGIYGITVMVTGPALAMVLRRRGRRGASHTTGTAR